VFVLTWDPLETDAPRPDGFTAANPGSPGLEIAVYVPIWRLIDLAAARREPAAATLTAIAGSAVVTAAMHEQEVPAGRYPVLVVEHSAPDLLGDLPAGATLGPAVIGADPPSWEDIGLGAIQDAVQHAFGPADLDQSPVELEDLSPNQLGCPACKGRPFGFPRTCRKRRSRCAQSTASRPTLSLKSASGGQSAAIQTAGVRWAARPSGENGRICPTGWPRGWPEPARPCTARRSQPNSPSAHERLSRRRAGSKVARDMGIALGEDPEYGPDIPDWLLNLVLDLGRAGLADEAVSVAEALGRVEPELRPVLDADLGVALAEAGRSDDARAQIAANLAAWPDDFWVRVHAGDALEVLGDFDAARAHFEAARTTADRPADRADRAAAAERLLQLSRKQRLAGGGPKIQRVQRAGKASRSKRRRGR
jgi:hypothetical protein